MLRPILAGLSAAVTLLTPAADHNLRVYPNQGDVFRYRMSGTIGIKASDATIGMNVTETVTAKDENGWTVEVATTGGLAKYDGQEVNLPESRQNITYGVDGLIRELRMPDGTNPDAYRLIQMASFFRPEKLVPQGVDFSHEFPADAAHGVPAARANYKIMGEEVIDTIPVLRIDFRYTEIQGDIPARNSGTVWLHKEKGVVVKLIQNWGDAPVAGSGPVSGKFTIELVP